MKLFLKIAKTLVKVEIDNELKSVIRLFKNFDDYKESKKSKIKLVIKRAKKTYLTLSSDRKILSMGSNQINDLANPFNLIGILQATFRFIGLHSVKNGVFLIHGSTAVFKKQGYCFSDDGKSIGKTLSAIECSLISKQFVGDEFCFLDINSWSIFSYSFIPLHLRLIVYNHLKKQHKLLIPKDKFNKTKAGIFIQPKKLFKIYNSVKAKAFIFVNFTKLSTSCTELNQRESLQSIKNALVSHLLKLIYPQFDRMQFVKSSDSHQIIYNDQKLINEISKKILPKKTLAKIARNIKCYKLLLKSPCEVNYLLDSIK